MSCMQEMVETCYSNCHDGDFQSAGWARGKHTRASDEAAKVGNEMQACHMLHNACRQ